MTTGAKHMLPKARSLASMAAALLIALALLPSASVQSEQAKVQTFDSPKAAAAALIGAARAKDRERVLAILGADAGEWIASSDPVQDAQARDRFIGAYEEKNAIEMEGGDEAVLVVGEDGFPFPIPIVKQASGWAFDAEQGREEILDRRIGQNELSTIQVLLAIVDAQLDYATRDWDGNGLRAYAARFRSSEGKQDGLYWPTGEGEAPSPLGPLVAQAASEGYIPDPAGSEGEASPAYHGYRFRLLTGQGENAPGGAYDYAVNGELIGGFATIAFPTKYGNSGVMTFMVSHDGAVYETDLGPETTTQALAIETFDPSPQWKKSETN